LGLTPHERAAGAAGMRRDRTGLQRVGLSWRDLDGLLFLLVKLVIPIYKVAGSG
jgi:hypothetical protein